MLNDLLLFKRTLLLWVLVLSTFTLYINAQAQVRQQYTGSNVILIGIESEKGLLEYRSDELQVRYNKEINKIECRLPVNTLYALNDSTPVDLAYSVLFGSKYPELVFLIDAPSDIVNAPKLNAEPNLQRATVEFQGTINETKVPVVFASDKGVINLSTSFVMVMGHFNATLPAPYIPFLNGRIHVAIRNARWLNNDRR